MGEADETVGDAVRTPDFEGTHGKLWRVALPSPDIIAKRPDWAATLGVWLLTVPGAHAFWHSYAVAVVHLRDVPGASRPPHRTYPEAEYELLCLALDPRVPLPDDGDHFAPAYLRPPNLVEQFHGVTDKQAKEIAELLSRSFVDGVNSPDTDWTSRTVASLKRTVEHYARAGVHAP